MSQAGACRVSNRIATWLSPPPPRVGAPYRCQGEFGTEFTSRAIQRGPWTFANPRAASQDGAWLPMIVSRRLQVEGVELGFDARGQRAQRLRDGYPDVATDVRPHRRARRARNLVVPPLWARALRLADPILVDRPDQL